MCSLSITRRNSPEADRPRTVLRRWFLCAAACSAMLLIGLLLFPAAGRDDAHITCWPARTLAASGEMLNYNGDRVEQSSSMLHVLLVAGLTRCTGLDPLTLGRIVSIVFGAACIVAVFILATRAAGGSTAFPAAILTALSVYFVYWTFGGLETTIAAFAGLCVIITFAGYVSGGSAVSAWWPFAATCIFILVRPETPVLLGCMLAAALVFVRLKAVFSVRAKARSKAFTVRLSVLFGMWAVSSCAVLLFRLWYFGSALPQPVNAKHAGVSMEAAHNGLTYLTGCMLGMDPAMTGVAITTMVATVVLLTLETVSPEVNLYTLLSLLYCAGYTAFVILSGGDWMEGGRFLVLFLPVAMALVPVAITRLTQRVWPLVLLTTAIAGLECVSIVEFARYWSTGLPLWASPVPVYDLSGYSWFERHSRINLRDAPVISRLDGFVARLTGSGHGPVVILSGQMGAAAYHLADSHFGRVRFMDRFGLADRTFTTASATRDLRRGRMGLQLWYESYFARVDRLRQVDRLPLPDIIFDIGSVPDKLLAAQGYTTVYRQSGRVPSGSEWFRGRDVVADEFIAIRNDLLSALGNPEPVAIQYGMPAP